MISAIVTAYNEERIVPELARRLEVVLEPYGKGYEILFVDDGSRDATAAYIEEAHRRNPQIKLLQFSRNFGQVAALRAGLLHAKGDLIVTMDGDLQDLPEEIPRLIEKLNEGYDIVYARREERKHSLFRNMSSRVFARVLTYAMARGGIVPADKEALVLGVFRVMRREVADAFNSLSEQTGYFQGLINWVGFRHAIVPVAHGARAAGKSHYTLRKLFRYGIEAIVFLLPFPFRGIATAGGIIAGGSFVVSLGLIGGRLIVGFPPFDSLVIFLAINFWGGIFIMIAAMSGEYISRALLEAKRRPLFIIKKKLL